MMDGWWMDEGWMKDGWGLEWEFREVSLFSRLTTTAFPSPRPSTPSSIIIPVFIPVFHPSQSSSYTGFMMVYTAIYTANSFFSLVFARLLLDFLDSAVQYNAAVHGKYLQIRTNCTLNGVHPCLSWKNITSCIKHIASLPPPLPSPSSIPQRHDRAPIDDINTNRHKLHPGTVSLSK